MYGHLGELDGDHLSLRQNQSHTVGGRRKTKWRGEGEEHSRKSKRV